MPLWYKAWRESRARFLTGAVVLTFLCVRAAKFDLTRVPFRPPPTFAQHIWGFVYDGPVVMLFAVFAVILGLGGLNAERTAGSQAFTLALPATRRRLLLVRAAVAALQIAALACIPLVTVPVISPFYQQTPYPAEQALRFALYFVVCGAAWCAAGLLWSSLLLNEHGATAACLLTPMLGPALHRVAGVNAYADLFQVVNGVATGQLHPTTRMLEGPTPWLALLVVAALSAMLIGAAVRVTEHQDF